MSERQKIMYLTDHNTRTGFGLVADNVCRGLGEIYDVYFVGWGMRYQEPIRRNNYTLLPTGQHPFGADILGSYIMQIKPEVLVVQADVRMVDWLPNLMRQLPHKPTWVLYPVIDGHVWDLENKQTKWAGNWTAIMNQADRVVAMTKFGQKILKANGIDAGYIPHGVDTGLFRPFPPEAKEKAKEQFGLKGKYVIGGVFKNIQRKHPEKYLQAFCLFRGGKEDKVRLLLHTPPNRQTGGEMDLIQMCGDYGLIVNKDVIFTQQGIPTQVMPTIFNAMDTLWILGSMESFNLPTIEGMACGIPIVAVKCDPHIEILGKTGLFSKIPTYPGSKGAPITFGSYNGIECPVPNPYDIAKKTERLYQAPSLRKEISFKETIRALKVYDWEIVRKKWVEFVGNCIVTVESLPEEWRRIYEEVK